MVEQAIFKSQAFGGFNKIDVLDYIDRINEKNSGEQESLNAEIASLNSELVENKTALSEKSNALAEKEAAFDELSAAYDELREHFMMLKEHSDNLESENERIKACFEENAKELEIQKELNRQLTEKVAEEERRKDEIAEEEKRLALAASEFGASTKAMVNTAKSSALGMVDDAESSAKSINAEIDTLKAELAKTSDFMKDSLSVLISRLDYISEEAEKSKIKGNSGEGKTSEFQRRCEEINREIDSKVDSLKKCFFH